MKSIRDEKLEYDKDKDLYRVVGSLDVYDDDCMACKYSRSSPLLSPEAKCSIKGNMGDADGAACVTNLLRVKTGGTL